MLEVGFRQVKESDGEGYQVMIGGVAVMSVAGVGQVKTRSMAFPHLCVG